MKKFTTLIFGLIIIGIVDYISATTRVYKSHITYISHSLNHSKANWDAGAVDQYSIFVKGEYTGKILISESQFAQAENGMGVNCFIKKGGITGIKYKYPPMISCSFTGEKIK